MPVSLKINYIKITVYMEINNARHPILIAVTRTSSFAIISQKMVCSYFKYLLIYLNYTVLNIEPAN